MTVTPETTEATMLPRTFGDQHMKVAFSPTVPPDLDSASAAFLNSALEVSCRLVKEGTTFRFTASETINEAAICEPAGAQAAGRDNYEATATVFRFWDKENPGKADMRITIKDGEELTRYESSGQIGEGQGVKAGITYRLPDGRMVYVPE